GRSPAFERGEGVWGNREVPPRRVVRRGHVRETGFPHGSEPEASDGQLRKPTCTFRNRAGDVPWETCACCPGCPLPQFVSPCSVHSSWPATASSEPQKTGVWPV